MKKKVAIMVAIGLVGIIILVIIALPLTKRQEPPTLQEGEIIEDRFGAICSLAGIIERIEIKDKEGIILQKEKENWIEEAYPTLIYNQEAVQSLLNHLKITISEQVIHNVQDLEKYGIKEGAPMVTLYNEENTGETLVIGGQTADKTKSYVWNEVHQELYIVTNEQMDQLSLKRDELLAKNLSLPEKDSIWQMRIEEEGEKPLILVKSELEGKDGYEEWQIKDFFVDAHAISGEWMTNLIDQLEAFEKDGFVGTVESLEDPGLLESSLTLVLNENWTIQFGKVKNGFIYFNYSEEPYIYKMAEDKMRPFINLKPIEMIRKEVYIPQLEGLKKITFNNPEESFILEVKEGLGNQEESNVQSTENKKPVYEGKLEKRRLNQQELEEILDLTGKSIRIEMLLKNPQIEQKENRPPEVSLRFDYKSGYSKSIELVPYDINFYILRVDGIVEFAASKQPVMELFNALSQWASKEE